MAPILEQFGDKYYTDCFPGREYMKYTLHIESIEKIGSVPSSYKVTGTHTYIGQFGSRYPQMPFEAVVTYLDNRGVEKHIQFYKRSKSDFNHSKDYWEECEKIMIDRNLTNY